MINNPTTPLLLKEYGRNVQNLIQRIQKESDQEKRSAYVNALIPIMIAVKNRKSHDISIEKIWQDIFTIAQYDLAVESPYPIHKKIPSLTESVTLPYPAVIVRKRMPYGKNVLQLLEEIKNKNKKEELLPFLLYITKWIIAFHKKNSNTNAILNYFYMLLGKDNLPDLTAMKEELQSLNRPYKKVSQRPRRFLKPRKKERPS